MSTTAFGQQVEPAAAPDPIDAAPASDRRRKALLGAGALSVVLAAAVGTGLLLDTGEVADAVPVAVTPPAPTGSSDVVTADEDVVLAGGDVIVAEDPSQAAVDDPWADVDDPWAVAQEPELDLAGMRNPFVPLVAGVAPAAAPATTTGTTGTTTGTTGGTGTTSSSTGTTTGTTAAASPTPEPVVTTPPAPVVTTPPAPVVTSPPVASPDPTAVPAPAPTTSVLTDATTYVVQAGDTLWRIAVRMYGGGTDSTAGYRWTEIAQANSIDGSLIVPGQTLSIPRP